MIYSVLAFIANIIIVIISKTGYLGIGILMAIDSCNIPIPSEVTMPFAGFLAQNGTLSLWVIILAGTIGSVIGSIVSYYIANWIISHRTKNKVLHKIFSDHSVATAERWFQKYGNASVFFGRMVPVVRTFISLPAGVARMKLSSFVWFTAAGSLVWSFILAYGGYVLGEQWQHIENYTRQFEYIILAAVIVIGAIFLIKRSRIKTKNSA